MTERTLDCEGTLPGYRQWGADWFFRRDGNKTSLNTSVIKWAGCAGVLVFAAIQLSVTSEPLAAGPNPDPIGVPGLTNAPARREFPVVEERPSAEEPKPKSEGKPTKLAGPQLIARPKNLAAIPPGSLMKATLVSGASNGPTKAKLVEPLVVDGDVVLETGATLVGEGTSTEERLLVSFKQVVFRDGSFGNVQAQACDSSDQIIGLKGSKVGTKALNIAGSIGLGFVGGLTEGLQETQGQQGAAIRLPTLRNAMLHATATTALEQSRNLMSDLKERKPIIEVPAGTGICVLFGGGQ